MSDIIVKDDTKPEVPDPVALEDPLALDEGIALSSGLTTTHRELWSYYLYYVGNNGLSGFTFGPSQFQNLLHLAGYDPSQPPFTTACATSGCVLYFLGKVRDSERSS